MLIDLGGIVMTDKQLQQLTKKELIDLYRELESGKSVTLDEAIKIVKEHGLKIVKQIDYTF